MPIEEAVGVQAEDLEKHEHTRRELYQSYSARLLDLQKINAESFDKWILTLSSGALGLSLSFFEKVIEKLKDPVSLWLLPLSWGLFAASISLTVLSFLISQKGLSVQLQYAEKYFLEKDESFAPDRKKNRWASAVNWVNLLSGFSFLTAVAVTVVFSSLNISQERYPMTEEKPPAKSVPMSQSPEKKDFGAIVIPPMPKVDTPSGMAPPTSEQIMPQMPKSPAVPPFQPTPPPQPKESTD